MPLPRLNSFKAILFDCDGTLVDTEVAHNQALSELFTELTGDTRYTVDYCVEAFMGKGYAPSIAQVERETGIALPPDLTQRAYDRAEALLPSALRISDGIAEALASLTLPKAVVSNGPRQLVMACLHHANLAQYFDEDHVFTIEQATPKPAPDLFLLAAKQLGVAPQDCLVFEDTTTGVQAATAAGMTAIGYPANHPNPTEQAQLLQKSGARHILDTFHNFFSL